MPRQFATGITVAGAGESGGFILDRAGLEVSSAGRRDYLGGLAQYTLYATEFPKSWSMHDVFLIFRAFGKI